MTIKEMHYDFKQKLNKIDSSAYRNLRVPEIDWKLNEALDLYIKLIAEPKTRNRLGLEKNMVITEILRPLVVEADSTPTGSRITLPIDFQHFVDLSKLMISKGGLSVKVQKTLFRQHNDNLTGNFDKSSFDWREVNYTMDSLGIAVDTNDDEFTLGPASIIYIKQHPRLANPSSFIGGVYNTVDNVPVTTDQSCLLPDIYHSEIVDLAVAITSGDINDPTYQIKIGKLGLIGIS